MLDRFSIAITFIKCFEVFAVLACAVAIAGGGLAAMFFLLYPNSAAETLSTRVLYAAGCALAFVIGQQVARYFLRENNAFDRAKDRLNEARDQLGA